MVDVLTQKVAANQTAPASERWRALGVGWGPSAKCEMLLLTAWRFLDEVHALVLALFHVDALHILAKRVEVLRIARNSGRPAFVTTLADLATIMVSERLCRMIPTT